MAGIHVVLGLFEGALFTNVNAFLVLMIILSGLIGLFSGYASIGAFGSFVSFTHIASTVDLWIFNSMLYIIMTIVFVVMSLQAWQFIGSNGVNQ
ncbi:hypothetical protein [His 1 virus]|uniref:Putative transmembrane protein ORF25 n=1 Tax=His1 virus (isolate Australia/Victoria) TaxID=654912 RepID=Y025_HIS1I|nr:hypothetical protein His1V_gp25 [His 1 virus]Q25BH0.1 RecName: Full=Putative transmembrane protein ORF25 [His1 virus (isolate Victoria)]AAQ13743.1 hypothetical protein [His 1 virus]